MIKPQGLSVARLVGALVALVVVGGIALFIWIELDVAAQHRAADRARQLLQEQLGLDADTDPVQFLGNRLRSELEGGSRLSRKQVDELVVGYTEKVERGSDTYYLFFAVVVPWPLGGRSGGIICARFDQEGFLESSWWDASDPLPSFE
jgi:hypothetical protein